MERTTVWFTLFLCLPADREGRCDLRACTADGAFDGKMENDKEHDIYEKGFHSVFAMGVDRPYIFFILF